MLTNQELLRDNLERVNIINCNNGFLILHNMVYIFANIGIPLSSSTQVPTPFVLEIDSSTPVGLIPTFYLLKSKKFTQIPAPNTLQS